MANKKILIAEDSSVIQNLAKRVLSFQNFDIKSAKNGQKVLEMLEQEDFDVILLDINMPVMDGVECVKQIRALENTAKAQTPVIAITGNAQNYSVEEFKAMGINEYIPKPINFDALIEAIKKMTE